MRRSATVIATSAAALALCGCGPVAQPHFSPPIQWSGTMVTDYAGDHWEHRDVDMYSVTLHADGNATLVNMPVGTWRQADEDNWCLDERDGIFTGPGKWHAISDRTVALEYDGSTLVLTDDGRWGAQDWGQVHTGSCEKDGRWTSRAMAISSGDPGGP